MGLIEFVVEYLTSDYAEAESFCLWVRWDGQLSEPRWAWGWK